jgi:hypothetical protein
MAWSESNLMECFIKNKSGLTFLIGFETEPVNRRKYILIYRVDLINKTELCVVIVVSGHYPLSPKIRTPAE